MASKRGSGQQGSASSAGAPVENEVRADVKFNLMLK